MIINHCFVITWKIDYDVARQCKWTIIHMLNNWILPFDRWLKKRGKNSQILSSRIACIQRFAQLIESHNAHYGLSWLKLKDHTIRFYTSIHSLPHYCIYNTNTYNIISAYRCRSLCFVRFQNQFFFHHTQHSSMAMAKVIFY